MRDAIDNEMTAEEQEALNAEIQAVAIAGPEDADTIQQSYQILEAKLLELSPIVRGMHEIASAEG